MILSLGVIILISLGLGIFIGTKITVVEKTTVKPLKAIKRARKTAEAEIEEDAYVTMLKNVDNYDGTPYGQITIKR